MNLKNVISFIVHRAYFIVIFISVWAVQHDPFFWDTVQLASKHAHHFYENGLRWTPLPPEIDSGHPPVFGFYLACIWTFFGKTLPASHWAMLPFLLGIVALLHRLAQRISHPLSPPLTLSPSRLSPYWLLPFVLLDPVLAGQMTLVSPDVALAFFFLLAVVSILERRPFFLALGALGLCAISMRGMMTSAALLVWLVGMRMAEYGMRNLLLPVHRSSSIVHSLYFFPGFAFATWFLWWHWQATGWIGYHPGSAWAPAFAQVQGGGLLRNMAVVAWRWLDFGRIFEWLIVLLLVRKFWRSKERFKPFKISSANLTWPLLFLSLVVLLTPSAVLYHNLSAHRYFLPGFLALHLLVFQWINAVNWSQKTKEWLCIVLLAGMATGNLWVYPTGISMDWDSTLAHQPYHRLRANALTFLEKAGVDFQTVGSAFPNLNTGENLLLNGDQRRFAELDWERNTYIFASNVFNDLSAADYERLQRDWDLQFRQAHAGVWIEIYRRH